MVSLIKMFVCVCLINICLKPMNLSLSFVGILCSRWGHWPSCSAQGWISKWVDYSDKCIYSYHLCEEGVGIVFSDSTKLVLLANGKWVLLQCVNLIFSHMYKTYPFSCKHICSISKYVSDSKWTYCTVLSNSQNKQIILVYYCNKMVWWNWNHNFVSYMNLFCNKILNSRMDLGCVLFKFLINFRPKNFVAVINRY